MTSHDQDARFEDTSGPGRPLRLRADTAEDLEVISSLVQDAVGKTGDISWMRNKRRLVILVHRFRWEGLTGPDGPSRPYERVLSAVTIESVLRVRARSLDPREKAEVFDLLAIQFVPGEDGTGSVTLTLAGKGEISVDVECLDLALADLSQPWEAKASTAPTHGT